MTLRESVPKSPREVPVLLSEASRGDTVCNPRHLLAALTVLTQDYFLF